MPTIQIIAIFLGGLAAGFVFIRSWKPSEWWFDSIEALLKAAAAFVCVVGAIWLVTLIDWDRGSAEETTVIPVVPPTATVDTATTAPEPTEIAVPATSTTVPSAPTSTVREAGLTQIFLDLGDCAEQPAARAGECPGESGASFDGWGSAQGGWSGMPFAAGGDSTLRDLQLGRDNQIIVDGLAAADFILTVVTADGACDDSFQIVIDGAVVYEYLARDPESQTFPVHTVTIPASAIHGGQLTITFRNIATDGCGLAGVFNVELRAI